jgi:ribosomal protein S18 acetylase RimI-like enzyme
MTETPPLYLRPARPEDVDTIFRWRRETAEWLAREKGTDQWSTPYPREKVERWVERGETYMGSLEPDGEPIATITVTTEGDPALWTPEELAEPAYYINKVNVVREHAGKGIGKALIEWGIAQATEAGVPVVRIDVWTTNRELQEYYERMGFRHIRTDHRTVSGALLQRDAEVTDSAFVIGVPRCS